MCPSYVNSASFSWWCPGHGFDLEFCPLLSKNFLFVCTSNPDPKDKLVSRLGPKWHGGEKREKEKVKRKRGEKGWGREREGERKRERRPVPIKHAHRQGCRGHQTKHVKEWGTDATDILVGWGPWSRKPRGDKGALFYSKARLTPLREGD